MLKRSWLGTLAGLMLVASGVTAQAPTPQASVSATGVPQWARARWETLAKARSLQLSSHLKTNVLTGKFDSDTTVDVALLVEHKTTHKIGIVFIHRGATRPMVIGAGVDFGNGGDNFDWVDTWKVEPPTKMRRTAAVFVEKESSASALIVFVKDRYVWRQQGD